MLYQPISQWHSLHFELLIELVAKKLTELWRFKNLAYFLTWWPSSMTYLFVNVTYWNCSPIPYVDQVWWWYVKAFMSYAWQNGQTNRQTDKRTYLQKLKILASNKPTNEHTCQNCKFWQVITLRYTPQKNPQKMYSGKMWSQLSWLHRTWRQGLHRLIPIVPTMPLVGDKKWGHIKLTCHWRQQLYIILQWH